MLDRHPKPLRDYKRSRPTRRQRRRTRHDTRYTLDWTWRWIPYNTTDVRHTAVIDEIARSKLAGEERCRRAQEGSGILRSCRLLLLEGGLDLDELGGKRWAVRRGFGNSVGTGQGATRRTSVFFCSDLSPSSFSCPSTRFLHRCCVLMHAG